MKSLEFDCLVDEHDGDIVFDFVQQLAFVADEPITLFVQVDITLALRAGEYFEKFFADGHGRSPPFLFLNRFVPHPLSKHGGLVETGNSNHAEVAVDSAVGIAGTGV